jgi:NADH dehydrogenase
MDDMQKKNIVVLGAGFGGLTAAMDVSKKLRAMHLLEKYGVVLIDRSDCHLFTPLLYKLAAAPGRDPGTTCTYDTTTLIKRFPIQFVQNEVASIDLMNGDIHLKTGEEIKADFLVIALGSETNYFGIQGLKEHSLQLKSADHALMIRRALEEVFAKGGDPTIAVGGAGANGIELAAEIRQWANRAQKENSGLHVSVALIEAMPTILPGLDPRVQAIATKRLAKLGVKVTTNAKIVSVSENAVSLDGGANDTRAQIPFNLFIWTGGIKTPDMLTALPLQKEPRGKPVAQNNMAFLPATPDLKLYPMVYGLGDSVFFMNPKTKRPVPAVARAAIMQAHVVAGNIIEEIKKAESKNYKPHIENYEATEYPYVIPIGDGWAVAKLGFIVFSSWPAWIFTKLIEINYLWSIMPLSDALTAWRAMH